MAPQKGKQATKGQKQIVEENAATLSFYRNMVFIANGIYLTVTCVTSDTFSVQMIILFLFAAAAYIGSFQFMAYMARPKYADSGQLLDSGVDLNMEGGIAEHLKDLIILTSGCQLLSLISNYFWLLWLLDVSQGFGHSLETSSFHKYG
ncbi:transmembrane protein 208 isoform X2 [Cryptotermes secundus]|uniref:transmembrane protein 208 isoform X2 n=1 Tax=Cryptotermes secundus TaxID=105785 RepID=UPI000CD7B1F6|nr:transmembrane protein 208 isoform X2 [Cryptotermes secundus]